MKTIFNFQFPIFDSRWNKRHFLAPLASWIALALPSDAAAQGCAMCYQSASAAKSAGLEALQNGVMILIVPPLLIFAAILWGSFHRREGRDADEAEMRGGESFSPQAGELDSPQQS